jgi:hypothetical protein
MTSAATATAWARVRTHKYRYFYRIRPDLFQYCRSVRFSGTTTVNGIDRHYQAESTYDDRCYDFEDSSGGGELIYPRYHDDVGDYLMHQDPALSNYPPPPAHNLLRLEDMASTTAASVIGVGMNVMTPGAVMPPPSSAAMAAGVISEDERKIVGEFCHLLEKSKQLFNGLRDLPQYGHKQWQAYFGRTFDIYTKLWKFQQQHRAILDTRYGLKRWQIGEIASKIGQLYYHY